MRYFDASGRDRARGALLGLACGDAVGTTLEFKAPGAVTPIDDMVGGGPFGLKPGEWTDDTSVALCLADSILDRQGLDAVTRAARVGLRSGSRPCTAIPCVAVGVVIAVDDPRTDDVRALLERHLEFSYEFSPEEHVHALDIDGLLDPAVTFFSARDPEGTLLGVGALKHLDDTNGELKSMHTTEAARRQGIGEQMLSHLLDVAESRGYERVSLETGTMDAYRPARAMYAKAGFTRCPPFGQYTDNPYSMCMAIEMARNDSNR